MRTIGAVVALAFAVGVSGHPAIQVAPHEPLGSLSQTVGVQLVADPQIRSDVTPPSSDFIGYVEGERVRVSIPSNWRELPGSNAVTFAPEGAYGNVGAKSVFTHGVAMGLARNDERNLCLTTNDFIDASVLGNRRAASTLLFDNVTIGHRPGLHAVRATWSGATGMLEQIEVFAVLLDGETLFYVLAVVPRGSASRYARTFRHVVNSIEFIDRDGVRLPGASPETPPAPDC